MKLVKHLSKEEIRNLNQLKSKLIQKKEKSNSFKQQPSKQKTEKLSQRDLDDLMDTKRDRYKRVNGAWRRA